MATNKLADGPDRESASHEGADSAEPDVRVPRRPQTTAFDRFAEAAATFVSNGLFFTVCVVLILVWTPTLAIFHSVDTWQLVINTLTSVLAFLLIALLQNSERRYDDALHQKIDALTAGLADLMEHQHQPNTELLRRHVEELRAAVGLEREV